MFFLQQGLKSYWEKRRDGSLKLATIRDDTWNVLNMQHITPNSKRWDYSDIPGGSHGQIKGPTHMVEGGHHPRNRPPTLGITSVDFYHYPVMVWAYSTPQPNTEVPAPTGGNGTWRNMTKMPMPLCSLVKTFLLLCLFKCYFWLRPLRWEIIIKKNWEK